MSLRQSVINKASRTSEHAVAGKQQIYNFPPILSKNSSGSVIIVEKTKSMLQQASSLLNPNNNRVTKANSLERQKSDNVVSSREKTYEQQMASIYK
jgi:hypothetical protein